MSPNFSNRRGDGTVAMIVTYRRRDGKVIVVREGWGTHHDDALHHADEQLPPGTWTRLAISTPQSIYADVKNAGAVRAVQHKRIARRGEGETVVSCRLHLVEP